VKSRARIGKVFATAPWPNRDDRSKRLLQVAARDQVDARMECRTAAATDSWLRAEQLRGRVGILGRGLAALGIETRSVKEANKVIAAAHDAERDLKAVRVDYRDDLRRADRSGAAASDRREAEQEKWEEKPDVRAARREEHGNDLVAAALKADDPVVRELLAREAGLRLAREALLKQEAERHRQLVVDGKAEGAMAERRLATGVITQPSPRR